MRAAYEKYRADGFVVLSVSVQEEKPAVDNFIAKYGLQYPFLMDSSGDVSRTYRVSSTPTTYFINPDGVISGVLPGVMTEQWIDANMTAVNG